MSGAERQRRYRQRQQRHMAVVPIEADLDSLIAFLIAESKIDKHAARNFNSVCGALSRYLAEEIARKKG